MSYIGNIPLPQATEARTSHTVTAGESPKTSFNVEYVPSYLDVFINGVLQDPATDYTATNGTSVTLTSGAVTGDIVSFIARTQTSALVALPLKDSAGNSILSESGSTVTLANVDTATIGSNALVVNSSGNVGIGRLPATKLDVELSSSSVFTSSSQGNILTLRNTNTTVGNYAGIYLSSSGTGGNAATAHINVTGTSSGNGNLVFSTRGNSVVAERMRIDSSGAVTMPAVYSDTVTGRDLYISSTGQLGYVSSIRNAKINISNLELVNWLYSLNPVSFQYRTKDDEDNYTDIPEEQIEYGLIAEEVETVNSDLVFYDETENGLELRGVQYSRLIAPLIKAVQQQKALIESQQSQIDALTARIEALETA